jgi:hypothetical protein
MSNIVWSAENGWHDGQEVTVSAHYGKLAADPIEGGEEKD